MNRSTLRTLMKVRGLNQSDLARVTGLSRQAVSLWFKQPSDEINIHSKNLQKTARKLGMTTDDLSNPLPILANANERKLLETRLLWDRLYPDLESFMSALLLGQAAAEARLVQVYGLFQAEKIAGRKIWDRFQGYKLKIAPARRKQAEIIWNLHKNQT